MKITINRECLKAVAPFMSKEETRFYLKGVFFGNECLTTTDGHRLATIKPVDDTGIPAENGAFIMPDSAVKAIMAVKPTEKKLPIYVEITQEYIGALKKTYTAKIYHIADAPISVIPFDEVNGTFPDYKRIIPHDDVQTTEKETEETKEARPNQGFNAECLGSFASLGKFYSLYIGPTKSTPAIIRAKNDLFDAVGLLMPYKIDKLDMLPSWL